MIVDAPAPLCSCVRADDAPLCCHGTRDGQVKNRAPREQNPYFHSTRACPLSTSRPPSSAKATVLKRSPYASPFAYSFRQQMLSGEFCAAMMRSNNDTVRHCVGERVSAAKNTIEILLKSPSCPLDDHCAIVTSKAVDAREQSVASSRLSCL